MGYTHYWEFKGQPKDIKDASKKLANAVEKFKRGMEIIGTEISSDGTNIGFKGEYEKHSLPLHLAGPCGNDSPIFNESGIFAFNGSCEDDGDYESFYIDINRDRSFNFCKTGRRPYDVAVCLALRCLKSEFGDDLEYSSDGDIENGEEGWGLSERVFNQI